MLALEYFQKSFTIRESLGDKFGMASCLNNIGLIYRNKGDGPVSLEYHQRAYKLYEEINDVGGVATSLLNIGNIYRTQNSYELALQYYQKCLNIAIQHNFKNVIAASLNNIGLVYERQKNYVVALEYYLKSLQIKEELNDKQGIALTYNNIASVYLGQNNYNQANEYFEKSLVMKEDLGDKQGQAISLNGLAMVALRQKEYDRSIQYGEKGLQIARWIGAVLSMNALAQTLFEAYKSKEDYVKALEFHELFKSTNDSLFSTEKAKAIANIETRVEIERKQKEIELLNKDKELDKKAQEALQKDLELQRIEADRQRNAKLAIEKQAEADKLLVLAQKEQDKKKQDSLENLAQRTQLEADNLKANELKLKAEAKARQLEVLKEKEARELQQKLNYLILLVLIIVLVFAFLIFRSRQQERRSKKIISEQKEAVLQQKEEIQQINEELSITIETVNEQKNEIEAKNKAIQDSIIYAQRIQQAILPLESTIAKVLPAYFILFKPRDVVSGDFYYFEEKNGKVIVSVIDCTGHGIPGAFMTMIASEILNEIIQNKGILEADKILNELHKRIRIALKQQESQNRDGMDLVLLVIDKAQSVVTFAGAKNSLLYMQNKVLHEIKGDKVSIGGEQRETDRIFTPHHISIDSQTTFYLFSDGYQDQFGGPDNKKFKLSQIRELLTGISDQPLQQQQQILAERIQQWMDEGQEKQIDDILVMGIQLG
ncbi:MAG TPA: hypothetical protein DCM08_03160 [Microscillaceae bacterium]|nr:hypothetical protein [Microscillaceae bacterium]